MPYTTNDLITHYNCGDLNTVIYSHDTAQVICNLNTYYIIPTLNLQLSTCLTDLHKNSLVPKLF